MHNNGVSGEKAARYRLPRTGILSHAPDSIIDVLEGLAELIHLSAGETLFEQGDEGDTLYAIGDGVLEISVLSPEGRKLALDLVTAGNLLGEIALFDPGPRTASVKARSAAHLLAIRRPVLIKAIEETPVLGLEITRMAARRMRLLTEQLHEQVFLQLPERLARKILHLTSEHGILNNRLQISHLELADFVGASREAVSRTLADWRSAGVVELGRQQIEIIDRPALRLLGGMKIL